ASIPPVLARDLVQKHDECCAQPDHHMPGLPRDDFAAIARALTTRLKFPVLSAAPEPAGWTFKGASVCPVGPLESAHLVFKRSARATGRPRRSRFAVSRSAASLLREGVIAKPQATAAAAGRSRRRGATWPCRARGSRCPLCSRTSAPRATRTGRRSPTKSARP